MSNYSLDAGNFKHVLYEILKLVDLDPSIVEEQVSKVMNSDIKYIPIRHHSPGSALLVKKAIEEYKPKLILIEGPFLANDIIEFIVDKGSTPPLAILSIFADEKNDFKMNGILSPDPTIPAKFQVYYPFISYSPEYVALVESKKRKIPSYFIDLPLTGHVPFMIDEANKVQHYLKIEEEKFTVSDFYQTLTQLFQFNSFNETWDSLFEIGSNRGTIEDMRECLLVFCSCVRQTIPVESIKIEGDLAREQYMKYCIDELIAKEKVKESEVLVITGGIHSVVLHATKPKKLDYPIEGLFNSLIPYSYFRISETSGYGSGNQGPSFYDYIWKKFKTKVQNPFEMTALEVITDIFTDARKKGHLISIADTINSFQSAKMLAMMRRRNEPTLTDIIDSIYMSVVKGNPETEGSYLQDLIKNRIIGYKIGKITKKIGKLPLQEDFYLKIEQYQIILEENARDYTFNLREEYDTEISQFFWRLSFLDSGLLNRISGPDFLEGETGVFTEVWRLHWSPKVDVKLIELNIYGSTVEEASKNKLIEESKVDLKNFERISQLLYQSLLMGMPNLFSPLSSVCSDSLELDTQYVTLAYGFNNLVIIYRYLKMMENQDLNLQIVENLIKRGFFAACFVIPQFANPPDDIIDKFVLALRDMGTTLIGFSEISLDKDVFFEGLKTCVANSQNDFIKGCCVGILYLLNHYNTKTVKEIIGEYVKSEDAIKVRLGEFIRGLIYECKTKLLFNDEIVKLLTEMIETLEWNIFNAILPSLRKTFSDLDSREYDVFVEKIAVIFGLKVKEIKEFKEDVQDQSILFFSEIDKKVRIIFEDWFGKV